MKKAVLKNFTILTGKLQVRNFAPTQVFFSEYCKIFMNIYFEEHLLIEQLFLYWPL